MTEIVHGAGWNYEYKDANNASIHNALEQLGEDFEGELKVVNTSIRRALSHADFHGPSGEAYVIVVENDFEVTRKLDERVSI